MATPDRLTMLDEVGNRKFIIPAEVKGRFHRRRTVIHAFLVGVFLALPWIRIGPTQALRLDIPGRRFEIFGQVFLSHDAPLIFFIFALFALSLMISTVLWGRAWCGWGCPQTVFIESIFRRIEILVEGKYLERRKLAEAPLSLRKIGKLATKWALFAICCSLISHSLIACFSGSAELWEMMKRPPGENWTYFLSVGSVSAILLFNFGWFREQFCVIMCPYGRFQSVLLDANTKTVVYDEVRGEPRRTPANSSRSGDCVSCQRCVQVCPTAIDIRNGLQMECIGCTACIDACDEIMKKLKKPIGLISYRSLAAKPRSIFRRPRVLAYFSIAILMIGGFIFHLAGRRVFAATVLRATETPYQISPDGKIVNHFKLHLFNQAQTNQSFRLKLAKNVLSAHTLIQPAESYDIPSETSKTIHLFVSIAPEDLKTRTKEPLHLVIEEVHSGELQESDLTFVGPLNF